MKIKILSIGVCLQLAALYVAFIADFQGNLYIATLITVAALGCITVIRSLIAPICLLAGVIVGLFLSQNSTDPQVLSDVEQRASAILANQPTQ